MPYFGSQRGNPLIFPTVLIRQMREKGKTVGCRKFIQNNPDLVRKIKVSSSAFIADLDTPLDLLNLQKSSASTDSQSLRAKISTP